MPFTRGDAKQFVVGLLLAVVTAVIFNFGALSGVSLRDVHWQEFGWDLLDNLFQSFLIYITSWWALTRAGIVRAQQVVPANTVRPRDEPVVEQIPPAPPAA